MSNRLNSNRNIAGYLCLMTGLMLSLSSNTISFASYHGDQFCMADQIRIMPINQTKLLDCVIRNLNVDTEFYYIGVAGILLLGASGILLSNLVFRRWWARTLMSDPTITSRESHSENQDHKRSISRWWSRHKKGIRDVFTIALVAVTVYLAWVTSWQLYEAQNSRDTANKLVTETTQLLAATNKSNIQLASIIDKNNQLLDILNKGLIETAFQTTLQTYNADKPYSLYLNNCYYETNTTLIKHGILILDNKQDTAAIDFKVTTTYEYFTTNFNGSTTQESNSTIIGTTTETVGPGKIPVYEVNLGGVLNDSKNLNKPYIYFTYQFRYNPFFSPKQADVANPEDSKSGLLIGFQRNSNTNEWETITSNPNVKCRG